MVAARTAVVYGLGDKLLAGAALTLNEDGSSGAGGDFGDKIEQGRHFGGDGDDFAMAALAANFVAESFHFGTEVIGFESVLYRDVELVKIDGLADEIVGAELEGALDVVDLGYARHHDNDGKVARLAEVL